MPSPIPVDDLPDELQDRLRSALRAAIRPAAIGAIVDLREAYFVADDMDFRRFAQEAFLEELGLIHNAAFPGSIPETGRDDE